MQTRTSSAQANSDQASVFASNAQAALSAALQADPYFFLSNVYTITINGVTYSEQARVCSPTGAIVEPGQSWSTSLCGTSWNYTPASSSASGWIELVPPSLANPELGAYIEGVSGSQLSSLYLTYRLDSPSHYSLWGSSNLDLSALPAGSSLSGGVYAGGQITLPSSSQTVTNAQLEAQQGFTTTPTDTSLRYYAATPTSATPPIQDITQVVPSQLTPQSLRSSLSPTTAIACPGGAPFWSSYTGTSSSLCLAAGSTVIAGSSTTASIPANVTGYLLVFNGSSNTVTVYYSTQPINPDPNCASACDFVTQGVSDSTKSPLTNPGELSYWTTSPNGELGVIALPQSGLIYTDKSTFLGSCSTGTDIPYTTVGGVCPTLSGSSPGMLVGKNVTVVAGSALSPADVWLDSSINTSPFVSFGVVASGSILLPYWARSPGASTTQNISGSYTALGYGVDSSTSPIRPFPSGASTSNPDNMAGTLNVVGSLAAPNFSDQAPFTYFNSASILPSQALNQSSPPYYASFNGVWQLDTSSAIPSSQLAFPAYPTNLTATAGSKQATLSWTPPVSAPTGAYYIVTSAPGGLTCSTQSTSCVVTGLTSGTPYTFTVQTVAAPQISASSLPSNSVTPS